MLDSLGSRNHAKVGSNSFLFCSIYPLIEDNYSKSMILKCYMPAKYKKRIEDNNKCKIGKISDINRQIIFKKKLYFHAAPKRSINNEARHQL